MAKVKVDFKVTPGAGVTGYWIAVGDEDVPLTNGMGSIRLATGVRHLLVWWFTGNPGSKIAIKGTRGPTTVVEVKGSKIPPGESEGAGGKRFKV